MASSQARRRWLRVTLFLSMVAVTTAAKTLANQVGTMSTTEIEDALQQCPLVQELNLHKQQIAPETPGYAKVLFEKLFPYGPAANAFLATLYISGPPNFLLALCPPNIDPSSLTIMVAFAVGGLLGDVLFHLLPEIFLGEAASNHARFVLVDNNKNILLGVAILIGFVTFVAMDKSLRIATGSAGHDHVKKEEKEDSKVVPSATSTAIAPSPNGSIKSRKTDDGKVNVTTEIAALAAPPATLRKLRGLEETRRANRWLEEVLQEDPNGGVTQIAIWKAYEAAFMESEVPLLEATILIHGASRVFEKARAEIIEDLDPVPGASGKKFIIRGVKPKERKPANKKAVAATPTHTPSQSIKLSAYLNLIADFTHNITDGLALSSSFYASPALGATTCVAVFFHEIPHEVGDFALLIQSGFSKRSAMLSQFVTAAGAFLGTTIGVLVQELSRDGGGLVGDVLRQAGLTYPVAASGQKTSTVDSKGLLNTGLSWGDMLLPFTAGTFLYVGTVAVIPELLETDEKASKRSEVKKTLGQFVAMAVGAGVMFAISWT